jgi:hypothetical protein
MKTHNELIKSAQRIIDALRAANKENLEMAIHNVKESTDWLTEGKSLKSLAILCNKGQKEWDIYNYAYEVVHDKERTERVCVN